EEDRAQVRDIPATRIARANQAIFAESLQDTFAVLRQGTFEQVEVRWIVEQSQYLVIADPLNGDAVLKRRAVKDAPQRSLLLREVFQSLLVRADANEFLPLELHRMTESARDLQQNNPLTTDRHLEEAKMDLRREQPKQPVLQLLVSHPSCARLEGRTD